DESTLASPRLCISRGDSINCSGFGPEANGWLLRLPPVLQALHGFSMPPIALTPMLDKLADTSMGTIDCSVDRLVKLAPIGHDQRMVVAQQLEYLQQRLVRQAVGVAAVAHEEPEQGVQRGFVLLARQLLDGELVGRLVVLAILCQATLEVGDFRQ